MKKILILIAIAIGLFAFGPGISGVYGFDYSAPDTIQCGPISPIVGIGAVMAANDIVYFNTLTNRETIESTVPGYTYQDSLITTASLGVGFIDNGIPVPIFTNGMNRKNISAKGVKVSGIGKNRFNSTAPSTS